MQKFDPRTSNKDPAQPPNTSPGHQPHPPNTSPGPTAQHIARTPDPSSQAPDPDPQQNTPRSFPAVTASADFLIPIVLASFSSAGTRYKVFGKKSIVEGICQVGHWSEAVQAAPCFRLLPQERNPQHRSLSAPAESHITTHYDYEITSCSRTPRPPTQTPDEASNETP